ncbi:MAG: phosphate acyltransferase PlsX, partial [Planctomycetes bacterium]|nr:phosphate acyltransferase PlsX [Planctomycetota bacterium]
MIAGIARAHHRWPDARFVAYGDEARVRPCLEQHPELESCVEFVHTPDFIGDEDRPMQAVRRGRNSSMGLAIQAVKDGHVQVAVSAGNTGALMALSKIILRTMEGIDRPALATLIPTVKGESVMLDLGANVEASEENLVQFAVIGAAYARAVLGLERPRVGLLNVGVEELKGHSIVKNAGAILRNTDLAMEFAGYVEGNGLSSGEVDVIVTDGFTGNVALKTAEGTARLYSQLLREAFKETLLSRLGYMLARRVLTNLRVRLDPRRHNGAMFLGL